MNTALYDPAVWDQPAGRVSDYNLPSAGQWQRTLIVQRLVEKRDPTAFFGLTVGHSTLGDAGGLAYVKAMIDKIGDRRVLVGMDLKRTQDTDDLAAIVKAGFKVHGRTSKTPMVCLTKGAIRVTAVDYISDLRAFDHTALSVEFTLPSAA